MARPKEFDEEGALDAAIDCFRAHGYEAVSVRELAEAMGISGPSLYNAFGDKRALFRRALARFVEKGAAERRRCLEGTAPDEALRRYFDELIARAAADPAHGGCMLVNAALDVAVDDAELRESVAAGFAATERFFLEAVEAGQRAGVFSDRAPPEDFARLLLNAQISLRVLARLNADKAALRAVTGPALAALVRAPD